MHRTKRLRHHKYLLIHVIIAKIRNKYILLFIQFNKIAGVVIILVGKGWAVIISKEFCSIIMK